MGGPQHLARPVDSRLVQAPATEAVAFVASIALERARADALEVFTAHAREIGLVILDMGMPVMAGPECFARLRTLSDVPVLLATGYSSDEQAQALTTQGAALIEKPFAARDLTATVGRLRGRPPSMPVLTRPSGRHGSAPGAVRSAADAVTHLRGVSARPAAAGGPRNRRSARSAQEVGKPSSVWWRSFI